MLSAVRRVPRAVSVSARLYTTGRTEGSVAQSKGFNKKEKAHEDQFVHAHEMEQLAKLRAQIQAKQQEIDSLQKDADAITNKTPKA
ncbi:hypothetical protein JR316_0010739 [Psilocybe cubensis]|uniref:Uncharacterized protein n=1 Tax=Psilocybe cubensis TaxID=181762 RepID=A0ACB8GP49_PSICU|nr:hypothetical protein JR316_0010739 [Psilocybe cubensis]KAH9476824.1 hypothetical protein JR316_0010739 [Psilocybe cubensis]